MEDLRARTTLFCGVLAFAIALSMLLRGRRAVHWLFAAFATDVAFWYASQSAAALLGGTNDSTSHAIGPLRADVYVRATAVLTVLLPQFAVHLFQAIVPIQESDDSAPASVAKKGEKKQPSGFELRRVAAFVGLPMLALALSPYQGHPVTLGLVYFYVFGFLSAALVSLWRRGRKSPSRAVRDRVRFLVGVGALATTFTLADFLSFLGVYLPPIGAVLSIVFIYVLSESLARPRLADIYELAGRLLVSTALAFALAGIFYGFITYVGRFGAMYLNAVLAAIVFLVLFEPLENEVRARVHQFFFRERYDLETSVAELRKRLAHVLETEDMVETVLGGIERSRRVTSAAVYLLDGDGDGFDLSGSIGATAPRRLESLAVRPLIERLDRSLSLEEIAREADARGKQDGALLAATANLGELKNAVVLAIRDDHGELLGLLCVADDRVRDAFTPEEISLVETVATQMGVALANSRVYAKMKERDRLAALGSMAAGLAHEVKNPLGAIKGAAQLLEEAPNESTAREFIGVILEETDRLNRVVGSFLDYARPQAGNAVPLDVVAAVRRTVQILSSQSSNDFDVKLELDEGLPRVKIDAEQFRQVLINLVQNAVQAMDGHGRVTIAAHHRRLPRASWANAPPSERNAVSASGATATAQEVVEVSVRDTGPGIPQKVLKNLFVPFFTTKEQGTGLGLAISQRIVQSAGGTIDVQSQAGSGTKFSIVLPAAAVEPLMTPVPTEVPQELASLVTK